MKLEVGMYIRTRYNGILPLLSEDKEYYYFGKDKNHIKQCCVKEDLERIIVIGTIPTHSIIDLIEVGDYINGCLVIEHAYEKGRLFVSNVYIGGKTITTHEDYSWELTKDREKDIKTILTHEQFEREAYKV